MDAKCSAGRATALEVTASSDHWPSLRRNSESSRVAHETCDCTFALIRFGKLFLKNKVKKKGKRSKTGDVWIWYRAIEAV